MKRILKDKTVKIFSLGLVLTSIVFWGILMQNCSNEGEIFADDFAFLTKEEKDLVSQFDIAGTTHNEVMGQVYDKLLENLENANLSPNEVLAMTLNNTKKAAHLSIASTDNFSPKLKNGNNNINKTLIDSLLDMDFKSVVIKNAIKLKSTSNESIDPGETIRDILSSRSQNLNTYLKTLLKITEKSNSMERYNKDVNSLIVKAFKNLDREEMEILLCASSTAKHSFEYWCTNLHNWENILLKRKIKNIIRLKSNNFEPGGSIMDDPNFIKMRNDIIAWDIAGALEGAIAGSITGPGIALCALAMSVTQSTGAAVINIFNNYGKSAWEDFKNEWKNIFGW